MVIIANSCAVAIFSSTIVELYKVSILLAIIVLGKPIVAIVELIFYLALLRIVGPYLLVYWPILVLLYL